MNISGMGGMAHAYAMASASRTPESAESSVGPDHDGDSDDRSSAIQSKASTTVNMAGQTLGKLINTSA